MGHVRRRQFLTAAGALLATPLARAQTTRGMPRIGFVLTTAPLTTMTGPEPEETVMRGFVHGLRALGYVDGKNIVIERRSAEGNLDRIEPLIRELVLLPVDVLVVTGTQMMSIANSVTRTVPIVVAGGAQAAVELGFVKSLARPGGNMTGLASAPTLELGTKRLEMIREILPDASRVAFLGTKGDWSDPSSERLRTAASTLKLTVFLAEVRMPEIEAAFKLLERERFDALYVSSNPPFFVNRKKIAEFAARLRVPDFHHYYQAVEAGALASYGHSSYEIFRRAAGFVDRILKGAKPAEMPIEQLERFTLALNLKTARALGLRIPPSVLIRADLVIE
jgi:putative ABC transport system substrate-binding protein